MVYANQQDNSGKSFVNEMTKIDVGFKFRVKQTHVCYYRENELGICMIIIYVDGMMEIGHRESIKMSKKEWKKFSL